MKQVSSKAVKSERNIKNSTNVPVWASTFETFIKVLNASNPGLKSERQLLQEVKGTQLVAETANPRGAFFDTLTDDRGQESFLRDQMQPLYRHRQKEYYKVAT